MDGRCCKPRTINANDEQSPFAASIDAGVCLSLYLSPSPSPALCVCVYKIHGKSIRNICIGRCVCVCVLIYICLKLQQGVKRQEKKSRNKTTTTTMIIIIVAIMMMLNNDNDEKKKLFCLCKFSNRFPSSMDKRREFTLFFSHRAERTWLCVSVVRW